MVKYLPKNYILIIFFFIFFFYIFRLKGFVADDARHGAPTKLTRAEEKCLVEYINLMAAIGYQLTKQQLLWEVKRILDANGQRTKFTDNLPGDDWYKGFLRCHDDIMQRIPQGISTGRAAITTEMIEEWFRSTREYKSQKRGGDEALKDPWRVWNMDETAFPACSRSTRHEECLCYQAGG